jgi:hypothetical protein
VVTGARNRSRTPGVVSYDFVKEERKVSAYYFYVHDPQFGPGFIKICSYFPYPAKVWVNGHEWAKRQAGREGLSYATLAEGFAACSAWPGCRRSMTVSAYLMRGLSSTGGRR